MTIHTISNQEEYDKVIEAALAAGHVIVMQRGFEIMSGPLEPIIKQLVWRHVLLTLPTTGGTQ